MQHESSSSNMRERFLKVANEPGATNLFLLLVLAMITIYPLLFGGFTTHDDVSYALNTWTSHLWEVARNGAIGQGRIGFFWLMPISGLPYLVDNRIWYLVIKFGSFLLLLVAIYYAVLQSFKSNWLALASLVFFLAFIQNGWDHNPLTAYPFIFNFCAILFLASIGTFATALDRKSLALAVFSGCLYFFALGNEIFILLAPIYLTILFFKSPRHETLLRRLMSGRRYVLAIALWAIAYLILYTVWRHVHPSTYDGDIMNGQLSLHAMTRVIATYSLSAFPLASLHFWSTLGHSLPTVNSEDWHTIFSRLNAASFIKPAVVGFLFVRLMTMEDRHLPERRTLFIGASILSVGIFLPNVLLGFVEKYQNWVNVGIESYVYTYYSYIFATVFSALLLASIKVSTRSLRPKLKFMLVFLAAGILAFISFSVEVRNQHVAFEQKLAHREWQLMAQVIRSRAFTAIPDGSTVIAPTLLNYQRNIAFVLAGDWANYVKYKTGKNILFTKGECKSELTCYSLIFHQAASTDNQFMVLAKLNDPVSMVSSNLEIYAMPPHYGSTIVGSYAIGHVFPKIFVNGAPIVNIGHGLFSLKFPTISRERSVQTARLTGNVDMVPERITLSLYSVEPRLRPLSAALADGIDFTAPNYPDFMNGVSGMSGVESAGRWTDGKNVVFTFKRTLPAKFTMEVDLTSVFGPNVGKIIQVRVGDWSGKLVPVAATPTGKKFIFDVKTSSQTNTIKFTIAEPTSPKALGLSKDSRRLGIMFRRLRISTGNLSEK